MKIAPSFNAYMSIIYGLRSGQMISVIHPNMFYRKANAHSSTIPQQIQARILANALIIIHDVATNILIAYIWKRYPNVNRNQWKWVLPDLAATSLLPEILSIATFKLLGLENQNINASKKIKMLDSAFKSTALVALIGFIALRMNGDKAYPIAALGMYALMSGSRKFLSPSQLDVLLIANIAIFAFGLAVSKKVILTASAVVYKNILCLPFHETGALITNDENAIKKDRGL